MNENPGSQATSDDSHADQNLLKSIDRYFDQCAQTDTQGLKPVDYRFRLAEPDIYMKDESFTPRIDVAPVITFVNKVFSRILQHRAQEARLVPLSSQILIRFNRGAGFYEPFPQLQLPPHLMSALANRIRLVGGMALMARNQPVFGTIRLRSTTEADPQEQQSVFLIYTYPSPHGESMLLKISP